MSSEFDWARKILIGKIRTRQLKRGLMVTLLNDDPCGPRLIELAAFFIVIQYVWTSASLAMMSNDKTKTRDEIINDSHLRLNMERVVQSKDKKHNLVLKIKWPK